ncbi:MAG: thiamine diphosphokinase [Lachnospiraceae bacterium]|nr:thiamine diphosphokinase [Lachnospiraceae bacterium]
MDRFCLIITGGDFCALPEDLKTERPACVIACDIGWRYAERLGLAADLAVGDFDSAPAPEGMPVKRVPSRKDDTDTMLAVKEALAAGYRDIVILCAFGGRLDHTLANIQGGAYAVSCGAVRVRLVGADTDALAVGPGACPLVLPRREDRSLSLFALSDRVEGLSLKGTKYDGDGLILESRFPLGVSNHWTAPAAEISFRSGILLIVQSQLKEGEQI